ncbi:MAG: hypothetical protein CVT66_09460 [Actinobacteria bacterium HGW-Actinobacteria-6]|jgi:hypothetical protein|nr:MAG: hypothetical protein CVT66_09460 [Actinobacteria bacterium HGW-Actinobacteria-6]
MLSGTVLLHEVAKRIILRYLRTRGFLDAVIASDMLDEAEGVDLTYTTGGRRTTVKVKADAYYGIDPAKVADRDLIYYRAETSSYGFEAIADSVTRRPGWLQRSSADELFYYRIALGQTEAEVAALMEEPDEVFFAELKVERDDLKVLPMRALQGWFDVVGDRFMSRPVLTSGRSAWHRIVPAADVEANIAGVRDLGSLFASIALR